MREAESGGRVKGAKRDRSHAQHREHGEDRPLDAAEHLAGLEVRWVTVGHSVPIMGRASSFKPRCLRMLSPVSSKR